MRAKEGETKGRRAAIGPASTPASPPDGLPRAQTWLSLGSDWALYRRTCGGSCWWLQGVRVQQGGLGGSGPWGLPDAVSLSASGLTGAGVEERAHRSLRMLQPTATVDCMNSVKTSTERAQCYDELEPETDL